MSTSDLWNKLLSQELLNHGRHILSNLDSRILFLNEAITMLKRIVFSWGFLSNEAMGHAFVFSTVSYF